ncbi:MAG: hypothetical protein K6C35_07245 [Eubacterium sp.]|nr:hypothetical protein [Eubacterium sp.]
MNENNENKLAAGTVIASVLVLIWVLGSIAGAVISAKTKKIWLMLIILGQFFMFMGIFSIRDMLQKKEKDLWFGAIFVLVGIGCIAYGIYMKMG